MLEELGKLQTGLPRDAPAPDEPTHDDEAAWWDYRPGWGRRAGTRGHQR
jgi:hypothetical protein